MISYFIASLRVSLKLISFSKSISFISSSAFSIYNISSINDSLIEFDAKPYILRVCNALFFYDDELIEDKSCYPKLKFFDNSDI